MLLAVHYKLRSCHFGTNISPPKLISFICLSLFNLFLDIVFDSEDDSFGDIRIIVDKALVSMPRAVCRICPVHTKVLPVYFLLMHTKISMLQGTYYMPIAIEVYFRH